VTPRVLALCTGNVMRSVLFASFLTRVGGDRFDVRSAGTHVVDGQAISARTLTAATALGDVGGELRTHRSAQVTEVDVAWADAVLTAEADHVAYVRARFGAATPAAQIGLFCRAAPLDTDFRAQMRAVAALAVDDTLDVADPAGLDQSAYDDCARTLLDLVEVFVTVAGDD
jgi:protein-tyrosine-phosphatase